MKTARVADLWLAGLNRCNRGQGQWAVSDTATVRSGIFCDTTGDIENYSIELSRKRLRGLVAGKDVRIRVEFQEYDRYGRIVGKVWVTPHDCPTCDKTLDVGLAQITSGMAWWFRRYAHEQSPEDQGRYEFGEQEAKAKKVGLWQEKNPQPPWEFRRK